MVGSTEVCAVPTFNACPRVQEARGSATSTPSIGAEEFAAVQIGCRPPSVPASRAEQGYEPQLSANAPLGIGHVSEYGPFTENNPFNDRLPVIDTLPVKVGVTYCVHPLAFPLAKLPCGAYPVVHKAGAEARAAARFAVPVTSKVSMPPDTLVG